MKVTQILHISSVIMAASLKEAESFQHTCRAELESHLTQNLEPQILKAEEDLLGTVLGRLRIVVPGAIGRILRSYEQSGNLEKLINDEVEKQASQYARKLRDLRSHRSKIVTKMAAMKHSLGPLQQSLNRSLRERKSQEEIDVSDYERRLAGIRKRIRTQIDIASDLKSDLRSLQINDSDAAEMKEESQKAFTTMLAVFALDNSSHSLIADVKEFEQQVVSLRAGINLPSAPIRFHGRLTDIVFVSMPNGDNIKYDVVLQNNGGAYDVTSGVFTAPVDGAYCFWAHMVTLPETPIMPSIYSVSIRKNEDTSGTLSQGKTSSEGILILKSGDRVYCEKTLAMNIDNIGAPVADFGIALIEEH